MSFKKILIIGFGSIGKKHFLNLKKIDNSFEIYFLCRKNQKINFEDAKFIHSLEKIELINPNFAIICNPSSMHIETAIFLANKKINFLIEKPLSNSLDRLEELNQIIKKNKIKAMVGYNLRFNRCLLKLKEIVASKSFGNILAIKIEVGQFLPLWRKNIDYRNYVSSQKRLGGGALLELSHEVDYMRWIFGEPISIVSNMQKLSSLEIDVEDYVTAEFILKIDGKNTMCSLHLDFLQHKKVRYCKVIFENSTLHVDLINNTIEMFSKEKLLFTINEESDQDYTYIEEINHFINFLGEDLPSPISIEDGIKTQNLIQSIYESTISNFNE